MTFFFLFASLPQISFLSFWKTNLVSLIIMFIVDNPTNICDHLSCPPYSNCIVSSNGIAECACAKSCPLVINVVCGGNGKTYHNTCEMKKDACESRKSISVVRKRHCNSKLMKPPWINDKNVTSKGLESRINKESIKSKAPEH